MSYTLQFIIVMAILAGIIGWIIYSLFRKTPHQGSACAGCSLSNACKKKVLKEKAMPLPNSCEDCPQEKDCPKKGTMLECGSQDTPL